MSVSKALYSLSSLTRVGNAWEHGYVKGISYVCYSTAVQQVT